MERHQRIYHGSHGHEGKQGGAYLAYAITEVEKTQSEAAKDDGEVEPWEECSLVREEDFRFDTGGEGDALA